VGIVVGFSWLGMSSVSRFHEHDNERRIASVAE
jgi:hypothetical protein